MLFQNVLINLAKKIFHIAFTINFRIRFHRWFWISCLLNKIELKWVALIHTFRCVSFYGVSVLMGFVGFKGRTTVSSTNLMVLIVFPFNLTPVGATAIYLVYLLSIYNIRDKIILLKSMSLVEDLEVILLILLL